MEIKSTYLIRRFMHVSDHFIWSATVCYGLVWGTDDERGCWWSRREQETSWKQLPRTMEIKSTYLIRRLHQHPRSSSVMQRCIVATLIGLPASCMSATTLSGLRLCATVWADKKPSNEQETSWKQLPRTMEIKSTYLIRRLHQSVFCLHHRILCR
jgi:hypothetical protein